MTMPIGAPLITHQVTLAFDSGSVSGPYDRTVVGALPVTVAASALVMSVQGSAASRAAAVARARVSIKASAPILHRATGLPAISPGRHCFSQRTRLHPIFHIAFGDSPRSPRTS